MMRSKVWIYGLACPDTGLVRYVGQSVDPKARLATHLSPTASAAVSNWVASLRERSLAPTLVLVERVADGTANSAEQEWIARFHRFGDLLNGGGTVIRLAPTGSSTAQEKICDWLSQPGHSTRLLADKLAAFLGRTVSQGTVSKISTGRLRSPGPELSTALDAVVGIKPIDWLTTSTGAA